MPFDFVQNWSGPPTGGGGDDDLLPAIGSFDIQMTPANPLPGQLVWLEVVNVSNFGATDPMRELDFAWTFDRDGETHDLGSGMSAAGSYGRKVTTYWPEYGFPVITCEGRRRGYQPVVRTLAVTMRDLDDIAWNRDVYFALDADFTGAPAAGGAVEHISTYAQLVALNLNFGNARLNIKTGQTVDFTDGNNISLSGQATLAYVTKWGAGANPIFRARNAAAFKGPGMIDVTYENTPDEVVIFGISGEGDYSPITGTAPLSGGRELIKCGPPAPGTQNDISITECGSDGLRMLFNRTGGGATTAPTLATVKFGNCYCTNWQNYGVGVFGGRCRGGAVGCKFEHNPLALLGPDANNVQDYPASSFHGPGRFADCIEHAFHENLIASTTGWSLWGQDKFIQHCWRIHPTLNESWFISVVNNIFRGSSALKAGDVNSNKTFVLNGDGDRYIAMNRFYGSRQGGDGLIEAHGGRNYIMNNLLYRANVYSAANQRNVFIRVGDGAGGSQLSDLVFVAFNTIVSDRSAESGATGDYSIQGSGFSGSVISTDNALWVRNHSNASSFIDYTPFSRGDDFRFVTGSAGEGAGGSLAPVRDLLGTVRAASTDVGAYDSPVSSAQSVSPPVNTGAPTIAALGTRSGFYAMFDIGTWTDLDPYLVEWEWQLNGQAVSDSYLTYYNGGGSGSLRLKLTGTNRSGVRVSVFSNTLSI